MKKRRTSAQSRIHDAAVKLFAESGTTAISVSDLAKAAGVARGTIYNNLTDTEQLFERVATQLAEEMDQRIAASYAHVDDPIERMSIGLRQYIKRAHEEPDWGKFLVQFGYSSDSLREVWTGPPMHDLMAGIASQDYDLQPEQIPSAIAMIGGAALSGMVLVKEGLATWRDAGKNLAFMVLRSFGVPKERALELASTELPELPTLN